MEQQQQLEMDDGTPAPEKGGSFPSPIVFRSIRNSGQNPNIN